MKSAFWFSFATLVVTSVSVSLVSLGAPAIYTGRPPDMPWPILTALYIAWGRWLFLLSLPALYFSLRMAKDSPSRNSLALIHLSASILLTLLAALSLLFPLVNTLYWD